MFKPRPKQRQVLKYRRGRMGVSAVPGSGKTHVLSFLAANLIAGGMLKDNQEVLIVTLVNSAVDNFSKRIAGFMEGYGLLPRLGYRVRTLHGLAHDIVRNRPDLVGLSGDFQIIDERLAGEILREATQAWLRANPFALDDYFNPDLDENRRDWVRRDPLPEMVNTLAGNFIRYAKDLQFEPAALRDRLDELKIPLPLAELGCAIYADYERALHYRGAVDFDDLIRLALRALQREEDYLAYLSDLWPYILEDEAQDSSRLQEQILSLLAGPRGNWVRVGDPNQAIYETFTTANPQYLRDFITRPDVSGRDLPNSGRSTMSIITLANHLVEWTQKAHPLPTAREALAPPLIQPTPHGDPQPNPPDAPEQIHLIPNKFSPEAEIQAVVDSIERWLPEHPDDTVAVLTPRNTRGFEVTQALKVREIPYVEILRSTESTRMSSGALANLLQFLAEPGSPKRLATAYRVWRRADREEDETNERMEAIAKLIAKCPQVEDYLHPALGRDWLAELIVEEDVFLELEAFREIARRWQASVLLPIDQIVLTLAQDIFTTPSDLAIAHKLSVLLRRTAQAHPDWRLPEMAEEIAVIALNERRFLGMSEDDTGFDPDAHKGRVTVATIHKAKGLEWDRVYLMSVSNYDFPSGMEFDRYISEKWFLRDRLNLEAEALAQLDAALSNDEYDWYEEGQATHNARNDYISERLRLLYVGITRARKELVITWNTGRRGDSQPAIPLVELQAWWEGKSAGRVGRDTSRQAT